MNHDKNGSFHGVEVISPEINRNGMLAKIRSYQDYKQVCQDYSKKNKSDLVLCATSAFYLARKIANQHKVKLGLFVRAYENFSMFLDKKQRLKNIIKSVYSDSNYVGENKLADFFIYNSLFMKDKLSPFAYAASAHVIYPPLNIIKKNKKVGKIRKVHMVGMSYDKGFSTFSELSQYFPEIDFVAFGKSSKYSKATRLGSNLYYGGWCSVDELFNPADVFLVPSTWEEPFGRVAIEALSNGCIVVVSNKGGLPETVDNNVQLIVDSDSAVAWKDKLHDIIDNAEYYSFLCREMSGLVEKYSVERQLDKLESIVKENVISHG
ncbi:glycosyltransferase family 4 protein [Billgrantia lactosivorans]|uniref:glycosyltransferase family 4 protein n=1 Tax=Billgrantia lactosivorans TaxID=2185141 RepID=UPI0013A703F2|nr:glycosyltransferase family 4 protein [Halomonas lactosivorans]